MDVVQLFCDIDDFVKSLEKKIYKYLLVSKKMSGRGRKAMMSLAEVMTILILYHSSNYKNFKSFYMYMQTYHRHEFPRMLSYSRFVELIPCCLLVLNLFFKTRAGQMTGIYFLDSTSISVCHNARISRNKVFKNIATRGKSSMGWFFGFKLHLIVNEFGELISFDITKANTHDTVPVKEMVKRLTGKIFADRGYLSSKLFKDLWNSGIQLITNVRKNMKNKLIPIQDKLLLRKRFIIETINDQLKNIANIEHSRHRSPVNCIVNILCGLISYTYRENKPSIRWNYKKEELSV